MGVLYGTKKVCGNLPYYTQTESWVAIAYKTTLDFFACPSFDVLRQETPRFRVVPIKALGVLIRGAGSLGVRRAALPPGSPNYG